MITNASKSPVAKRTEEQPSQGSVQAEPVKKKSRKKKAEA